MVLPQPPAGTLEQWIHTTASSISSTPTAAAADFSLAWVQTVPWQQLLQVLCDVAAALTTLHHAQQPAVAHGAVHAGAVHLLQPLERVTQDSTTGRIAQLSLAGLLTRLAPVRSCHPLLSAPEVLLGSGPPTPAADVYSYGLLLFQVATGWLPQHYTPGTDEQLSAAAWIRDMLSSAGSTSPVAAAQALAAQQQQQQQLSTQQWTPYGRHLPSVAALQLLPPGYVSLMEACLHRVPLARPCMQHVAATLQQLRAAAGADASHASGSSSSPLQSVAMTAQAQAEAKVPAAASHSG